MPMRLYAKVMGIAVAAVVASSFGLYGCMWQQGAASEEELAQQVTYEDADTKPQTTRKVTDADAKPQTTQNKSQGDTKKQKKTTGSKGTSQNKQTESSSKK